MENSKNAKMLEIYLALILYHLNFQLLKFFVFSIYKKIMKKSIFNQIFIKMLKEARNIR